MARPPGVTNADFPAKRAALLESLFAALVETDETPSLRGLARAAGVSVPTLRHYFGDRDGVVAAVFAHCRTEAAEELRTAATPAGDVETSIAELLRHAAGGMQHAGFGRLNEMGLREGLASSAAAAAYLQDVLEPTLAAFAERIRAHVEAGELRRLDARTAAVQLLSPLLVAFLHQHSLGGAATWPLEFEVLVETTAATFVRGNRPTTESTSAT